MQRITNSMPDAFKVQEMLNSTPDAPKVKQITSATADACSRTSSTSGGLKRGEDSQKELGDLGDSPETY
jgi:hypothetical protein